MTAQIQIFDRSAEQTEGLKSLVESWLENGDFWPLASTMDATRRPSSLIIYAYEGEEWLGAALCDIGAYETELLYIYSRPEARGQGIARQLLTAVRKHLQKLRRMTALFLEVRTNNLAAISLYESLQMERIGIRKKYYANGDDAYVYRWRVPEERVKN